MKREVMVRVLMVAGVVVAFAAGHKAARSSADTPDRDSASRSRHGATAGFEAGFKESLTGAVAGASWEASPSASVDFELRDETLRLFDKTPVADLEAWRKELGSLEEQRIDDDKNVPLMLREMLLKELVRRGGSSFIEAMAATATKDEERDVEDAMDQWLEREPVAALRWLDGEVPEWIAEDLDDHREDALGHWLKRDPVAALDWLDGAVPEGIAKYRDDHREDALVSLLKKDPAEFEKRLSQVSAELREDVLEDYGWMNGTPEGRIGLLARAAKSPHGEAMALWSGLIRREGDGDPARAYATLGELDVSAEDRTELDERLMSSLLYVGAFSTEKIDGTGVMRAWVMRHPGEEVSESTLESFGGWSGSDTEQAAAWLGELPSGARYDAFAKALMGQRIRNFDAAAGVVARIDDEEIHKAMLWRLKASWTFSDPYAAAAWEKGLPEEDRERLREIEGE
jgi:hypothetical protein